MSEKNRISVFFPVYKDELTVRRVTEKSLEVLREIADEYEVIIVNDCSPDRSGEIAEELAREYDCVRVIHHENNLGYGAAIRSGFAAAKYEWIGFTDGDDEYEIRDLKKLFKLKDYYDLIITFRYVKLYSTFRIFVSWVYNVCLRFLFRTNYRDISTGLRLARKSLIDETELTSMSPFIGAELTIKTMLKGYRVGEVGIQTFPREFGRGSATSTANIYKTIVEMLKMRRSVFSSNYEMPDNRDRNKMDNSKSFDFKKFLTIALIIAAIGLGLRLFMVWQNTPLMKGGDEFEYESLGKVLSETGRYVSDKIQRQAQGGKPGEPTAYRTPVLPAFLAIHYKLFGFDNTPPRISLAFLSALCCLVIALLAWNLGYPIQGLIASVVWAVWPSDLLSDFVLGRLYPETLGSLFFLSSFAFLAAYLKNQRTSFLIGSSIFIGLTTLSRGYVVLTIPLMVLFVFYITKQKKLRTTFIFCLFAGLIIGAWMTRNWIMMGKPVLSTQTDTFWIGNNPWSRGSLDGEIWGKGIEAKQFKYLEAIHPNILEMSEIERSDMFLHETWIYVKEHPMHYIKLLPRKTSIFFGPFQNWSFGFYKYHYAFSLMLIFAFIGFLKIRNAEDRNKILLLTIPIAGVYIVVLITYALDRYRFTIEPFIVMLGVIGLTECYRYIRHYL
jgi:glycosyltransferase involved in cell wall biosynthesis